MKHSAAVFSVIAFLAIGLLTPNSLCQKTGSAPAVKAACGPEKVKFKVKLDRSQRPPLKPEPGKALIYIFQEYPEMSELPTLIMKVGLDGTWMGANQKRSYFAFKVDPGVHHLCVSGQWPFWPPVSVARVVARPDGIYYFGTQFYCDTSGGCGPLNVEPVDPDEANLLIQTSAYSISHPK